MIKHYDLFAGIGGFSLALDTIFHEQKNEHIFCEWEAFPTAVLKKHWPYGTYYGDIADLVTDTANTRIETVHQQKKSPSEFTIVTGGFPCQPFSHAGRRNGTADDRYKWPDMFKVIQNTRPDWVIAENVRGLVTWNDGMVLKTVCADLESEGYEVQPIIIPACAIGAPHRRDRVWIVANTRHQRQEKSEQQSVGSKQSRGGYWNKDWPEVAFATCNDGMDDGFSRQMDGITISASRHRTERLKACGNAIVPQVAMEIFQAIKNTY